MLNDEDFKRFWSPEVIMAVRGSGGGFNKDDDGFDQVEGDGCFKIHKRTNRTSNTVISATSVMAPANQPSSKVSSIDVRMTPSGSGSVAPTAKIAKKISRASNTDLANQPRFKIPGLDPRVTSVWRSLTTAQGSLIFFKIKMQGLDFIENGAKREVQNPEIMELISKIASSNFGDQDSATREVQNPEIMELTNG
ncbi:hypothetical protein Ddye_019646 [Dipteronia dyeriana]|uniref:Uncharacterized protein n=1 Tax=Dipteronia dyeriana TaxID=168575 RepID=A0AAD9TYL1_9ROSI|nr:hypothetical protein Ddye_019646 [Dipteronia dyeriana]